MLAQFLLAADCCDGGGDRALRWHNCLDSNKCCTRYAVASDYPTRRPMACAKSSSGCWRLGRSVPRAAAGAARQRASVGTRRCPSSSSVTSGIVLCSCAMEVGGAFSCGGDPGRCRRPTRGKTEQNCKPDQKDCSGRCSERRRTQVNNRRFDRRNIVCI